MAQMLTTLLALGLVINTFATPDPWYRSDDDDSDDDDNSDEDDDEFEESAESSKAERISRLRFVRESLDADHGADLETELNNNKKPPNSKKKK